MLILEHSVEHGRCQRVEELSAYSTSWRLRPRGGDSGISAGTRGTWRGEEREKGGVSYLNSKYLESRAANSRCLEVKATSGIRPSASRDLVEQRAATLPHLCVSGESRRLWLIGIMRSSYRRSLYSRNSGTDMAFIGMVQIVLRFLRFILKISRI